MSETQQQVQREPIDISVLTSFAESQGDEESDLVVELIDLYLTDSSRRLADMRQGLATADESLLARAAHALRGSSGTLGAWQVAESCEEMERLAFEFAFAEVALVLERLAWELTSVRQVFLTARHERTAA
ncbi:MAG TPA: Hpt domain-containing protein [Pyrinomonadaceae bacterium]|jgi:HPt (histidine-containing phosphotransfer) domain-containing protein|nr:Hpt domain-containing protein [Pyrinomonadaceae bacterium]